MIDAGTAKNDNYKLGDEIGVAGEAWRNMTVSGIAKFGSVDSIGGATFAVFDVPTAQKLLDKEGQFDVIYVTPKSGVSEARSPTRSSRCCRPRHRSRPARRPARPRPRRSTTGSRSSSTCCSHSPGSL